MTTTATLTLSAFLLARIAEDEAMARSAQSLGRWALAENIAVAVVNPTGHVLLDPARVLAECGAKRAIVEFADEASGDRESVISEFCVGRDEEAQARASDPGQAILRALAAVYGDHADYQESWRP